jgi:CRISPR-associated protein Csm2
VADARIKFGQADRPVELFSDIAKDNAKKIADDGKDQRGNQKNNKSSQLRKFYDELVMWHDKVFEHGVADRTARYKELAPFIKMLCAKVSYARGRGHVSASFEDLYSHVVKSINGPETLKDAKLFIEAFMGFYKAEEK